MHVDCGKNVTTCFARVEALSLSIAGPVENQPLRLVMHAQEQHLAPRATTRNADCTQGMSHTHCLVERETKT